MRVALTFDDSRRWGKAEGWNERPAQPESKIQAWV